MTDPDDRSDELRDWYAEDDPDGAALLDDVKVFLARFVVYPNEHALIAHVLWIVHTWLMPCWESTPRIAFLSPEPGSGKSRALEVTEPLVPRPVHAVNTTSAYLFRKVSDEAGPPTILYDEIDTVFGPKAKENEDVRGLLNAGHRKGAVAGRCVVRGKIVETEELPAYCAVALAGLDDLPDTLMTRSVIVRMQRRAPGEKVEPWRLPVNGPDADRLRARIEAWTAIVAADAVDCWPAMPDGIEDRPADVWESLLAVADLAGGHWPETARCSAVAAVAASMRKAPTIGVLLLKDLLTIFKSHDQPYICSESVLTELKGIEESPWGSFKKNGDPIDARGLARHLRRYGIESHDQRVGGDKVQKVYFRAEFEEAWARYLPDDEPEVEQPLGDPPHGSATSATSDTSQVSVPLVTGPGRCDECGWHIELQGHRDDCSAAAS